MWRLPSITWGPDRLRRARAAVILVATVVVVTQWVRVIDDLAHGDFRLHWSFGQRFVAGEYLYRIGHTPYPPFWGMACAPLSFLPRRWAHVTAYPIGIGSLAVLVILLNCLTRRSLPLAREPLFWSTTLALALSSRFIIRELPECGPNLLMVALAWGAIALWRRGRDDFAGLCLGLAIALKCTQALFVPYFVLKRQWRMVGATTAFTLLFSVLPVLRQGPALYERHLAAWGGNCWKGLRASDPSVGSARPGRSLERRAQAHAGAVLDALASGAQGAHRVRLAGPVARPVGPRGGCGDQGGHVRVAGVCCMEIPPAGARSS